MSNQNAVVGIYKAHTDADARGQRAPEIGL